MAFDPKAIREAIKDQLKLHIAKDIEVFEYKPASPNYPYIAILTDDPYVGYHETFKSSSTGALCDVRMLLEVAQNGEAQNAQMYVDDLLSSGTGRTSSVIDAIEADRTLGGKVDTCIVSRAGPIVPNEEGAATALLPLQIALRRT
jgi:hypothetical protein